MSWQEQRETTRPETIMADVAICVNPNDERYQHLIGKQVLIPLIKRAIPVIADDYVEIEFGTGCLKVTPAHDTNDYELGKRHNLPIIDLLNEDGTLNEKAQILIGEDRFIARKKIIKLLEESGDLVKVEEYRSNVGHSERTDSVIEPRLSEQWFLKMEKISKPALDNVMNDTVQLIPAKFKNTYRHWMENVRDWNISRQLWWGHRIPAFYLKDGTLIVAKNKREALRKAQHEYQLFALTEEDITQDPDVLDTWFSSWLWPISVFSGIKEPDNEDVNYYYPTNDLVTAPEILFFWVARMIIAGYEYKGTYPFKNVYLTGIVRDKQGRKMSKSLGNSPDPIDLINLHGADGVRTGMLFSSQAGNDLPYDDKLVEQGRNFCNKIWNAFRLVKGWEIDSNLTAPQGSDLAVKWFESKLNVTLAEVQDHFEKFRISDALNSVYKLIWDDFCAQYLEMIKPAYEKPIDPVTFEATLDFFDRLMRLAHPFMPFISEEIWQNIAERGAKESICVAEFPKGGASDAALLNDFEVLFELISGIRNIRNAKNLSPKTALPLAIRTDSKSRYENLSELIVKLGYIETISFVEEDSEGTSFRVKSDEFFINLADEIDVETERENLQKELEYTQGFLESVIKKLSNERFVANAKGDIVEKERQKQADAEAKIVTLKEALVRLG
jgi:valyl-tRNA synthetase